MDLGLVDGEVVVTDSNKIKAMLIILKHHMLDNWIIFWI